MYNAERERRNRQYYLARGRCPQCGGERPVVPGLKMCEVCREVNRQSHVRTRAYRKANGLCKNCGKPLDDLKHVTCGACRAMERKKYKKGGSEEYKRWYYEKREQGRCVSCGGWAVPGRSRCEKCAKLGNESTMRSDPGHEKFKLMRQERVKNGLCIDCGKPAATGRRRCEKHLAARRDSCRKYEITRRIRQEMANV